MLCVRRANERANRLNKTKTIHNLRFGLRSAAGIFITPNTTSCEIAQFSRVWIELTYFNREKALARAHTHRDADSRVHYFHLHFIGNETKNAYRYYFIIDEKPFSNFLTTFKIFAGFFLFLFILIKHTHWLIDPIKCNEQCRRFKILIDKLHSAHRTMPSENEICARAHTHTHIRFMFQKCVIKCNIFGFRVTNISVAFYQHRSCYCFLCVSVCMLRVCESQERALSN